LPNYVFYSPDLDDDGHDPSSNPKEGLIKASSFLKKFLDSLLQNPPFMKDTLIVVTFDESKDQSPEYRNHIYTVFLGNMVKPGEYRADYNHYNVLRTIEENFGLSTIAEGDGGAKPITDVWR
jgi:acid phosphatase